VGSVEKGNFDLDVPSDEDLIGQVRNGSTEAYGLLYERHLDSAEATARRHAGNSSDVFDLVAESFAKVLAAIQGGNGPKVFFRAYLLTTLRRLASAQRATDGQRLVTDDMESVMAVEAGPDPVVSAFEDDVVARSFRDLPERWQAVLWYSEVDGMAPAAIAPMLGLAPNAVSALAIRAREGLRQAYLQHHVGEVRAGCEGYAKHLGAYARGTLAPRRADRLERHLESCTECGAILLHVKDVGAGMRGIIFPALAGLAYSGREMAKTAALDMGNLLGAGQHSAGMGLRALLTYSAAGLATAGALTAGLSAGGLFVPDQGPATAEALPTISLPAPPPAGAAAARDPEKGDVHDGDAEGGDAQGPRTTAAPTAVVPVKPPPLPGKGPAVQAPVHFLVTGSIVSQGLLETAIELNVSVSGARVLQAPTVSARGPQLAPQSTLRVAAPSGWNCVDNSTAAAKASSCTSSTLAAGGSPFVITVPKWSVAMGNPLELRVSAAGAAEYTALAYFRL
jgi:RNA polymerase sigma factor (sigma-70 family)